ncbi:hypothetical protein H9P43_001281 [Blastocladiella emersonii ATCC 22665]|nr:hypothetical protein H9P43_001281 [Blastocladiella emersonii ATCC 22665]
MMQSTSMDPSPAGTIHLPPLTSRSTTPASWAATTSGHGTAATSAGNQLSTVVSAAMASAALGSKAAKLRRHPSASAMSRPSGGGATHLPAPTPLASTGLARQTVDENARMSTVMRQINTYLQNHGIAGATGANVANALAAVHGTEVIAVLDVDARELVMRELLELQRMVEAARTGGDPSRNSATGYMADVLGTNSGGGGGGGSSGRGGGNERGGGGGGGGGGQDRADRERRAEKRSGPSSNIPGLPSGMPSGMAGMTGYQSRDNRGPAGRKSIRTIAAEMEEKIQMLKNNPSQWEVFCARVAAYKAAKKYNRQINALQNNMQSVSLFDPRIRAEQREIERREHEEHRRMVSIESKRQFEERQRHRQKLIEKSQKQLKTKPANPKLYQLQYKWLILGSLASRMFVIHNAVHENHVAFLLFKRKSAAARTIQRAWREYKRVMYERRRRWAMRVLGRAARVFVAKLREQRRQAAANTIRDFLKEIHDVGKLLKIIKKFRFAVITAQRIVRRFLAVRAAQLQLLHLQWEKFEPEYYGAQKATPAGSTENLKPAKGKKPVKKKREELLKDDRNDFVPIPMAIRTKLLTDVLVAKRKAFHKQKMQYARAFERYEQDMKTQLTTTDTPPEAPKRPSLKVLLEQAEMLDLIKRGYSMAHSSKD